MKITTFYTKTNMSGLKHANNREWSGIKKQALKAAHDDCQNIISQLNPTKYNDVDRYFKEAISSVAMQLQTALNKGGELVDLSSAVEKLSQYTNDVGAIRRLLSNIIVIATHKGVFSGVADFKIFHSDTTNSIDKFISGVNDLKSAYSKENLDPALHRSNRVSHLDRKANLELAFIIFKSSLQNFRLSTHPLNYVNTDGYKKDRKLEQDAFIQFMQCYLSCEVSGDNVTSVKDSFFHCMKEGSDYRKIFDVIINSSGSASENSSSTISTNESQENWAKDIENIKNKFPKIIQSIMDGAVTHIPNMDSDVVRGKNRATYSIIENGGSSKQLTSDKMTNLLKSGDKRLNSYAKTVLDVLINHKAEQIKGNVCKETLNLLTKIYNNTKITYHEIATIPTPEQLLAWVSNTSNVFQKQIPNTFKTFLLNHQNYIGEILTTSKPQQSANDSKIRDEILKFLNQNDIFPTIKNSSGEVKSLKISNFFAKEPLTVTFELRLNKYIKSFNTDNTATKIPEGLIRDIAILKGAKNILEDKTLSDSKKIANFKILLGEKLGEIFGYQGFVIKKDSLINLYLIRLSEVLSSACKLINEDKVTEIKAINLPVGLANRVLENQSFINSVIQVISNTPLLRNAVEGHPIHAIQNSFKEFFAEPNNPRKHHQLLNCIREVYGYTERTQNSSSDLFVKIFEPFGNVISKSLTSKKEFETSSELKDLCNCKNVNGIKDAIEKFAVETIKDHDKEGKDRQTKRCAAYTELSELIMNSSVGTELHDKYRWLFEVKINQTKTYSEFMESLNGSESAKIANGLLEMIQDREFIALQNNSFKFIDTSGYGYDYKNSRYVSVLKYTDIPERDKLDTIVVHHGNSINDGHYVSYVNREGCWFLCNDKEISQIEDINSELAKFDDSSYQISSYSYKIPNDVSAPILTPTALRDAIINKLLINEELKERFSEIPITNPIDLRLIKELWLNIEKYDEKYDKEDAGKPKLISLEEYKNILSGSEEKFSDKDITEAWKSLFRGRDGKAFVRTREIKGSNEKIVEKYASLYRPGESSIPLPVPFDEFNGIYNNEDRFTINLIGANTEIDSQNENRFNVDYNSGFASKVAYTADKKMTYLPHPLIPYLVSVDNLKLLKTSEEFNAKTQSETYATAMLDSFMDFNKFNGNCVYQKCLDKYGTLLIATLSKGQFKELDNATNEGNIDEIKRILANRNFFAAV